MWAIPTRPYFRALYCKRYTRWINGLGTRLVLHVMTYVSQLCVSLDLRPEYCIHNMEDLNATILNLPFQICS